MPNIISISSHVAFGAVGNRIIVPALEMLGVTVTAINTVQLPWHPGMNARFGVGTKIVPDDQSLTAMIDNLSQAPWLGQVGGLMSGYLGSPAQAGAIANLIRALKQANPNALYLCDPVIGDKNRAGNGGLYVPEATAIAIRHHLWPLADIVTPNLFEFGWMTDEASAFNTDIIKTAKALNKRHVVVTSIDAGNSRIGNLLVSKGTKSLISQNILSPTPNGTGDMLAALFLGSLVIGQTAINALNFAAGAVFSAIKRSNQTGELSLEPKHLRAVSDDAPVTLTVEDI